MNTNFVRIQTNKWKILIDFLKQKTVAIELRWEMVRSAQDNLLVCIYFLKKWAVANLWVCVCFLKYNNGKKLQHPTIDLLDAMTTFGDAVAWLICSQWKQLFTSDWLRQWYRYDFSLCSISPEAIILTRNTTDVITHANNIGTFVYSLLVIIWTQLAQ